MFTDDFCDDWDSSKNQNDFIETYFCKKKVNSTKVSNVLESLDKPRNIDVKNSKSKPFKQDGKNSSNPYLLKNKCNKKIINELKSLHTSEESYSEVPSKSQNMLVTEPFHKESNHLITMKKRKKPVNNNDIVLNKSSEQMSNIKVTNAKTKIIMGSFSPDSIKHVDFHNDESESIYLKKKKRLRNKAKSISEEKSSICDKIFDKAGTTNDRIFDNSSTWENNLSGNNSDSNCFKIKKKKCKNIETSSEPNKLSDETQPSNIDAFYDLSLKKNTLLQNKAYQKLQAAKFRYLNEMLYTNSGNDALSYFQENNHEFLDYHEGFQSQVSKWPVNPVEIIIQELRQMSKQAIIADLGCGEAKIAGVFPNRTVYSFDLIALKDCVTACDMANVPLSSNSVDVIIFCLSLMGTNWKDYLKEGHRILKLGGIMKIAEIESRIENLQHFKKEIENFGFSLINENASHKMFVFLNFKGVTKSKKSSKVPPVTLKPCLYKKR